MDKPVLRQSLITSLLNCGEQVRLGKVVASRPDLIGHKSEALFYGTKFHRAVESYFQGRLYGYSVSHDDVLDGLRQSWHILEDGVPVRWQGSPESVLASAEKLVKRYLDWVDFQPQIIPLAIEKTIRIETEYAWLEGTLDMTTKDGILDWKTASTYESARDVADHSIQSWVYTLLESGGDIKLASEIPFVYHTAIKQTYQIYPFLKYARKEDLEILVNRMIPAAARLIREDGPYTPNPLFRFCSSNFCSVWDACRGGKIKL